MWFCFRHIFGPHSTERPTDLRLPLAVLRIRTFCLGRIQRRGQSYRERSVSNTLHYNTYYTAITALGSQVVSLVLRANIFICYRYERSCSTRTTHVLCFENYYCVVVRSSIGFQLQITYHIEATGKNRYGALCVRRWFAEKKKIATYVSYSC